MHQDMEMNMDNLTVVPSPFPVTGVDLGAGSGDIDAIFPSVADNTSALHSAHSFGSKFPSNDNNNRHFASSLPLIQFNTGPSLSRKYLKEIDPTHPVNKSGNVTGDTGLSYTPELLKLHQWLWSLPDEQVWSRFCGVDMLVDDSWRVWVRRLMACTRPLMPPDGVGQANAVPDLPLLVPTVDPYSDITPSNVEFDMNNVVDGAQGDTLPTTVDPRLTQLDFVNSQAFRNASPRCDTFDDNESCPGPSMNNLDTRSTDMVISSPSTLVDSINSTPSTVTVVDYFSPSSEPDEDEKVSTAFERNVHSTSGHPSLGYHDTGTGVGIFFPVDFLSPSVDENQYPSKERVGVVDVDTSTKTDDISDPSVESSASVQELPEIPRGAVPSNTAFTWIEPSLGPIRTPKCHRSHLQRQSKSCHPRSASMSSFSFDSDSDSVDNSQSYSQPNSDDYTVFFSSPPVCGWTTDGNNNPLPAPCSYTFTTPTTPSTLLSELETHLTSNHLPSFRSDMQTNSRGRISCAWKGCMNPKVVYPGLFMHLRVQHLEIKWRCERCGGVVQKGNEKARHRQPMSSGSSRCDVLRRQGGGGN
ncbi:hypothetical protein E1B28_005356 [Marasmius oreades]|uniref:Uncharacterized protein n=1 Tax=Marasmius oreades TaxID=181124 RepID=A0A9P7S3A0_9AGAR|nr:uncharacterized protein E1B28_005356 [Marasmius oreades]KAG7094527.1 hypothetical protein E1B28_005356 [Marasmius oreades]